jgi:hypothetical protein
MDAEPTAMRFEDLFLILSQGIDLGLLTVASDFRASRDLTGRFILVLESGHPE